MGLSPISTNIHSLVGNTATNNGLGEESDVGFADGFQFFRSEDNTVTDNEAVDNSRAGFGIFDHRVPDAMPPLGVNGSDDNTFVDNTADNNNIGFHVVGISELNTFQENHGASNGDKDASDDSNGAGNDWVDNVFGANPVNTHQSEQLFHLGILSPVHGSKPVHHCCVSDKSSCG